MAMVGYIHGYIRINKVINQFALKKTAADVQNSRTVRNLMYGFLSAFCSNYDCIFCRF